MVFDDPVVYDGDFGIGPREVGMSVAFGRGAMCCPAGMGNAGPRPQFMIVGKLGKLGNPPYGPQPLQMPVIDGNASGVVTPVFKAAQSLEESGNNIDAGNRAHYAAHTEQASCTELHSEYMEQTG